jgi:hypothetical protein
MRNAVIIALALFTLPMSLANAITLYEDPETGQVFTKPAPGRVEMNYPTEGSEAPAIAEKPAEQPADKPAKPASSLASIDANPVINNITIMDPDSPQFPLGKETRINMKFVPQDNPDMWFQAGVRMQGTMERLETDFSSPNIANTTLNDAYFRRLRLEVGAGFGKHTSFTMDIRNDRVNQGLDGSEREFTVGDAYVQIKKPFDTSLVNFKLYRAKIDVSRSETIKSAYLVDYDRPLVADYAANFISFNRRGANVQMFGDWKDKIHYQIAMGEAINGDEIETLTGRDLFDITDQSFFYGGKVILSPFNGWEEIKKTETYMGQGKHFSVGVAYWTVPEIKGTVIENFDKDKIKNGPAFDLNHELINIEASAHYKGFFVQSEYFKFFDVVNATEIPGVPANPPADAIPGNVSLNTGESNGWYVLSEYVMPNFYFIAPFVRYETWDRFEGQPNTDITSTQFGANWYLRGNTTKVGLVFETTKADEAFITDSEGNPSTADRKSVRITSQFFF